MNIGDRIGDYEIVEILGAGGMGQVFKVRNVLSDRIEAMKVLLPNLEGDPSLADRFLNEIKVQATLDHPNIAKLHTAMRSGNQVVMVMEFVDGTSLAEMLQRGPLAPGTAAAYAAEVLDALGYAHAHGVIHRDIKPANIMLTSGGQIKLMDFGIARVQANRHLTQTGSTIGSLSYLSPEQIKGSEPDGRSDLYSLGITMYEMVTGRRPFLGDSDFQIMSAHLQQAPMAPIEVIPGIPTALSDIILMAIEKDPAARFQSAEAFRGALASAFPAAVASTRTMAPVFAAPVVAAPVAASITAAPLPIKTPPPLPHAETPQPAVTAPWVIQPAPARSRRGLYMALGSVLTLAVLVAAVIEGPKLMRGGAADAQGVPASAANPSVPISAATALTPSATSEATPQVPPAAQAAAGSTAPPVPMPDAAPVAAAAPAPSQLPRPIQQPVPAQYAFRPAQPPAQPARTAQPAAIAQAAPAVQAAPVPAAPASPAVTAATASPELKELRDRINRVAVRAAAAQAGVRSIEQGVQAQGLGLRGDIQAASIRLDYVLQEARASLQNSDVEGARNNLQYAEGTLQKLEKFLGQ
jgi:serine/threonine-protein kinase